MPIEQYEDLELDSFMYRNNTSSSDDDFSGGIITMIVLLCCLGAVLILAAIVLLIYLLRRGSGGGGGKSPKAVYVEDNETSYKESRGGARMEKKLNDKVQVEFPDTTISLQQDHKTEAAVVESTKGRKHIMMNTTSTSTRDYKG
eukprot:TRINITY_DN1933_c0_g1_i4.p2 TRINITY_DN1933_c0_g1~~TRINITY_DN1933_c0_g1_i4.p2  ORF type:complete len:144 (-),score=42.00 TRINITY_DN1933_c0_g1_i4:1059-1490(-)